MLSISRTDRYFVYAHAADMRKGFDGLCGLVREEFSKDPLSGDIFVFLNHRRDRIKLLQWQGDGFAVFSKRLEKGTYERATAMDSRSAIEITSQQMLLILEGIPLLSKKRVRYSHSIVGKLPMTNALSLRV